MSLNIVIKSRPFLRCSCKRLAPMCINYVFGGGTVVPRQMMGVVAGARRVGMKRCCAVADPTAALWRSSHSDSSSATPDSSPPGQPLELSASCVSRLKQLCGEASPPEAYLRITVEGGGCSGFQYKFDVETRSTEAAGDSDDDVVIARDGVEVRVDSDSINFIRGSTIDFTEELIRSAFQVTNNPQAEGGCSCGVSFAIKL